MYTNFDEFVNEIYGNTNPDCPGHEYPEGENSRVEWCDFAEDCPDAPMDPDAGEYRGPGCTPGCGR